MTSRRQFLKILPYSFLLTACKPLVFDTKKVVKYELAANKSTFNFNEKFKANLFLYNNANPGPLLKANVGDILKIDFKNNLDQPTSIHWHGIKNINKMDGVPYLTQDPVQPGETFSYEFPVNQSGTYWYHAHFESWKQVAKGLYGPLVVNDKTDDLIEDDIVILADDWRLNKNYQIDEKSFGSLMDWSHAGRIGNWLTINGKKSPQYSIKENSIARLRFINASNARILKFGSSLKFFLSENLSNHMVPRKIKISPILPTPGITQIHMGIVLGKITPRILKIKPLKMDLTRLLIQLTIHHYCLQLKRRSLHFRSISRKINSRNKNK